MSSFIVSMSGKRHKKGVFSNPGLRSLGQIAQSGLLQEQSTTNVGLISSEANELKSGSEESVRGFERFGAQ